jgi:PAS domain S-box-containing protein
MRNHRTLLFIAGAVYLFWWFAVEWLIPGSFNPLGSRVAVVATIFTMLAATFISRRANRHGEILFVASVWLITAHFFYLFVGNDGDMNWIVGSFITVSAISIAFISRVQLLAYSIFTMVIVAGLHIYLAKEHSALFFPGMLTILLQANVSWGIRFRVLQSLTSSNERFAFLFNSTFEGILVHDLHKILLVNDALTKLFEYEPGEMVGMDILKIVDLAERDRVRHGMAFLEVGPYEMTGITKFGNKLELEVRGKEFTNEGKKMRLVTTNSVGDRKKAESERVRAATMTENVRLRDEFISIASHELRTPLSSLKLQSDLLKREFRRDESRFAPEKFGHSIGIFNRQVDRLVELVETMLDTSRGSVGDIPVARISMNLSERVRAVVETLPPELSELKRDFIHVDADKEIFIHADPSRIGQVIENLLTNAIKYGDGRPIRISVDREEQKAILRVADQGIGIAPENLDRIFDRFERAVTNQSISGLGLGLYITRKIIEAHGGTIEVQSLLGKGSTFIVRL